MSYRFYHRMCKKGKLLELKSTNVFFMLVYDTSVNHMHLFIQLKPDIHPHTHKKKETDPFGAHKKKTVI